MKLARKERGIRNSEIEHWNKNFFSKNKNYLSSKIVVNSGTNIIHVNTASDSIILFFTGWNYVSSFNIFRTLTKQCIVLRKYYIILFRVFFWSQPDLLNKKFNFSSFKLFWAFHHYAHQWKQYLVVILRNWNFVQASKTFEPFTNLFTGGNYPNNS
jgi:hypothetical protein